MAPRAAGGARQPARRRKPRRRSPPSCCGATRPSRRRRSWSPIPNDRQGLFSPSSLSLLAPLIAAAHRAPLVLVADADAGRASSARCTRFIDAHQLRADARRSGRRRAGAAQPSRSRSGAAGRRTGGDRRRRRGARRALLRDPERRAAGLCRRPHRRPRTPRSAARRWRASSTTGLGHAASRRSSSPTPTRCSPSARPSRARRRASCATLGLQVRATTATRSRRQVIQRSARRHEAARVGRARARSDARGTGRHRAPTAHPPLVVLQGCYTLDRSDPFILLERGTQAIVATSAAIYSASGSAFARAFVDALLYDERRPRHRGAQRAQLPPRRRRAEEAAPPQRLAKDLPRRARLRALGRSDRRAFRSARRRMPPSRSSGRCTGSAATRSSTFISHAAACRRSRPAATTPSRRRAPC